jgi:hypothetical protein
MCGFSAHVAKLIPSIEGKGIEWNSVSQDADRKLCRHYVS